MTNKINEHLKRAFTLAEVLICIGIIGVISAMTIPTLVTNYQKKATVSKLQQTYSELANAVRLSEADNGDLSGWNITNKSEEVIDKYLLPYIKASKKNYKAHSFKYTFANGSGGGTLDIVNRDTVVYTILSGVQIITSQTNKERKGLSLVVDLNGVKTPPNKLGRDTFYITIYPDFGVQMAQRDENEVAQNKFVLKSRKTLLNGPALYGYNCKNLGVWCGALIQRDGWKISKDYPW